MASSSETPYARWTSLADHELTVDGVNDILGSIPDDSWVAAACVDRVVDHVPVQQALLQLGIARTNNSVNKCKDIAAFSPHMEGETNPTNASRHSALVTHFQNSPTDARICSLRAVLLQRLDRLNTYVEMEEVAPEMDGEELGDEEIAEEWDDDPWADGEGEPSNSNTTKSLRRLPFPLSSFLFSDLLGLACELASSSCFDALRVLFQRNGSTLWPYRFTVYDNIPEHTHPSLCMEILPTLDYSTNFELINPQCKQRAEVDFSEASDTLGALQECGITLPTTHTPQTTSSTFPTSPNPLSADDLSTWYKNRVNAIISSTGMVDIALATVQHSASHGIPSLDELGEELSLLSRLVYDSPQNDDVGADDWTLSQWYSMDPSAVVRAYLAHSTPETVPHDISRLVMPYLFVLESRAERAGTPDPSLPTRHLYDYIMSVSLDMCAAIFEASKPTLPAAQRLIRDDEDVARLALACLYGSDSLDEWSTMSRIFECLPAWDIARDQDSDEDAADTTVASLGDFVKPTTSQSKVTARELFIFFKPLPLPSLSRALDILDVHLESGEILSRWSVPAPLRWFLQSGGNIDEQRAWANRMARRAGGSEDQLNTKEDWEWLLQDMLKLTGKGETGLMGAFGLLTKDEVIRIFLSGLLSTGKFTIARDLLYGSHKKINLDHGTVEDICLACSRELYDNSSSGNFKFGDMRLAYECLNVPLPSERIVKEKEFIEATSRISSFNVQSQPGISISPIEIRLTKDRLSLISRVLSGNDDAYKHSEVILELCFKLGFRQDPVAEIKVLAMLADAALQAEDFSRAYEYSERMTDSTLKLRSSLSHEDVQVQESIEVCWIACFQLGRHPEFDDLQKKLFLLGRALELCPSEKLHDVLTVWGRIEEDDIEARENENSGNATSFNLLPSSKRNVASSLRSRLQDFHMPSPPLLSTPDAAALASRTFRSVAANFPFSVGGHRGRSQLSDANDTASTRSGSQRRMDGEDVSAHATRVLSKGIGWLIGADEE